MYTIEHRSYGAYVTLDNALTPSEMTTLATDLKRELTKTLVKKPYEPLGIVIKPSSRIAHLMSPQMVILDV
jgi:hypothetical protein